MLSHASPGFPCKKLGLSRDPFFTKATQPTPTAKHIRHGPARHASNITKSNHNGNDKALRALHIHVFPPQASRNQVYIFYACQTNVKLYLFPTKSR